MYVRPEGTGWADRTRGMTDARELALPAGYGDLLASLKERVRAARLTALRAVNT